MNALGRSDSVLTQAVSRWHARDLVKTLAEVELQRCAQQFFRATIRLVSFLLFVCVENCVHL